MGRFVQVLLWTDSKHDAEELLSPDVHECVVLQIQEASSLEGLSHPLQDADVREVAEQL